MKVVIGLLVIFGVTAVALFGLGRLTENESDYGPRNEPDLDFRYPQLGITVDASGRVLAYLPPCIDDPIKGVVVASNSEPSTEYWRVTEKSSVNIERDVIDPIVAGEVPVGFEESTPLDSPLPPDRELLMILIGMSGKYAVAYFRVSELEQNAIELSGVLVDPETFAQTDCPKVSLRSPLRMR